MTSRIPTDDRFRVVTSHVVPLYPVFVQVVQNSQTAFITIFRHALSVVQLAFAQCPGRSPLAMLTRLWKRIWDSLFGVGRFVPIDASRDRSAPVPGEIVERSQETLFLKMFKKFSKHLKFSLLKISTTVSHSSFVSRLTRSIHIFLQYFRPWLQVNTSSGWSRQQTLVKNWPISLIVKLKFELGFLHSSKY